MDKSLHNRYSNACEKRNIEQLSCVLEACKKGSTTFSLAGNCISVDQCKVLAKILSQGHSFTDLDLTDCLIGDEGLSKLMEFLKNDMQLVSVVLKGNNLKLNGADTIANILKRNSTLERLSLEWNSIGMQECSMKVLCEGISLNTSLHFLDLRSNHIDHVGASYIANTLLTTTLQELDLRWNNIGIIGGRKLLSALKSNNSLIALRLDGNNIPSDTTDAIGTTLTLRLNQHMMKVQRDAEAMHFSAQIDYIHSDAQQKMIEILDTLDRERAAFLKTTRLSQQEIADLKCNLEERDVTVARLENKLLEMQCALRESLSKQEEKDKTIKEVKTQTSTEEQNFQLKIKELEMLASNLKEENAKKSMDASTKEQAAETKIRSLESEVQNLTRKVTDASCEQDAMKEDLKAKLNAVEAQLNQKETIHKNEVAELQEVHCKELSKCMEKYQEKEAAIAKRVCEIDRQSAKFEEEMRTLKLEKREEKTKAMEEIGKLQQALKLKTMKNDHLEDQIEELKNNHMTTVETLRSKISHHQSEKTRLEEEMTSLRSKTKALREEFEKEKTDLAKSLKSQKEKLKEAKEENDTLHKELKRLKKSLDDVKQQKIDSASEINSLKTERNKLQVKMEEQKTLLQRFQKEEQRISALKVALNTYYNSTP